jgi:hypothetical protein
MLYDKNLTLPVMFWVLSGPSLVVVAVLVVEMSSSCTIYLRLRKKSGPVITEQSHWIGGAWPWFFWSLSKIRVALRLAVRFTLRFSAKGSVRLTHYFSDILMLCIYFDVTTNTSGQDLLIIEASWSHPDTTLGRTPLDHRSARRRRFYRTKHNTTNRQSSMPPVGFETAIAATKRPQT